MNGEFVHVEIAGGIAEIVLDRPPVNALSTPMLTALREACRLVSQRSDVAAVVLRSSTPKVFSAGADIAEMRGLQGSEVTDYADLLRSTFEQLAVIPKPVVSALTGIALGGGCELALATDHRIAGRSLRIGQPEVRLGVVPAAGGSQRLPRLVGPAVAKQLLFTGQSLDAEAARRIGLVDEVLDDEEVPATAREWARQFVHGPGPALAAIKVAVDAALDLPLADGLELETSGYVETMNTVERVIGMTHFLSKAPGDPVFR